MKTCTILTILCVCTSFRVETKNLLSQVKENPLTIDDDYKNLERILAELSDKNHDASNSEEIMSKNLNALAYEIGLLKIEQLKNKKKIKSLEDEINLSKNQTIPQERGYDWTPFVFIATKSKPSGPIELPSGTILNYDRALANDGCLIAFDDSTPEWYIPECFNLEFGQFKAPENGHYLFFVDAPVFYHDAHINEYAQAAIDFIYFNHNNLDERFIVRSFLDSVDSVDFVPISNNLRQTQRSLTGFFTQRMFRGDVMTISNRFEKTISVGPWQLSITFGALQLDARFCKNYIGHYPC